MDGMALVMAGEDTRERDFLRLLPVHRPVRLHPGGEFQLRLLKIVCAERNSASLSSFGVEPGAAPGGAVRAAAEPEVAKLEGPFVSLAHGCMLASM
ncbi:MAG: hypothetical protein BroJett029_26980 [Alphaproteobacteria bacterium]|nr:MAG: hypothetical protein BroJett029_26980 [Alphaproteobacteria bacterium]